MYTPSTHYMHFIPLNSDSHEFNWAHICHLNPPLFDISSITSSTSVSRDNSQSKYMTPIKKLGKNHPDRVSATRVSKKKKKRHNRNSRSSSPSQLSRHQVQSTSLSPIFTSFSHLKQLSNIYNTNMNNNMNVLINHDHYLEPIHFLPLPSNQQTEVDFINILFTPLHSFDKIDSPLSPLKNIIDTSHSLLQNNTPLNLTENYDLNFSFLDDDELMDLESKQETCQISSLHSLDTTKPLVLSPPLSFSQHSTICMINPSNSNFQPSTPSLHKSATHTPRHHSRHSYGKLIDHPCTSNNINNDDNTSTRVSFNQDPEIYRYSAPYSLLSSTLLASSKSLRSLKLSSSYLNPHNKDHYIPKNLKKRHLKHIINSSRDNLKNDSIIDHTINSVVYDNGLTYHHTLNEISNSSSNNTNNNKCANISSCIHDTMSFHSSDTIPISVPITDDILSKFTDTVSQPPKINHPSTLSLVPLSLRYHSSFQSNQTNLGTAVIQSNHSHFDNQKEDLTHLSDNDHAMNSIYLSAYTYSTTNQSQFSYQGSYNSMPCMKVLNTKGNIISSFSATTASPTLSIDPNPTLSLATLSNIPTSFINPFHKMGSVQSHTMNKLSPTTNNMNTIISNNVLNNENNTVVVKHAPLTAFSILSTQPTLSTSPSICDDFENLSNASIVHSQPLTFPLQHQNKTTASASFSTPPLHTIPTTSWYTPPSNPSYYTLPNGMNSLPKLAALNNNTNNHLVSSPALSSNNIPSSSSFTYPTLFLLNNTIPIHNTTRPNRSRSTDETNTLIPSMAQFTSITPNTINDMTTHTTTTSSSADRTTSPVFSSKSLSLPHSDHHSSSSRISSSLSMDITIPTINQQSSQHMAHVSNATNSVNSSHGLQSNNIILDKTNKIIQLFLRTTAKSTQINTTITPLQLYTLHPNSHNIINDQKVNIRDEVTLVSSSYEPIPTPSPQDSPDCSCIRPFMNGECFLSGQEILINIQQQYPTILSFISILVTTFIVFVYICTSISISQSSTDISYNTATFSPLVTSLSSFETFNFRSSFKYPLISDGLNNILPFIGQIDGNHVICYATNDFTPSSLADSFFSSPMSIIQHPLPSLLISTVHNDQNHVGIIDNINNQHKQFFQHVLLSPTFTSPSSQQLSTITAKTALRHLFDKLSQPSAPFNDNSQISPLRTILSNQTNIDLFSPRESSTVNSVIIAHKSNNFPPIRVSTIVTTINEPISSTQSLLDPKFSSFSPSNSQSPYHHYDYQHQSQYFNEFNPEKRISQNQLSQFDFPSFSQFKASSTSCPLQVHVCQETNHFANSHGTITDHALNSMMNNPFSSDFDNLASPYSQSFSSLLSQLPSTASPELVKFAVNSSNIGGTPNPDAAQRHLSKTDYHPLSRPISQLESKVSSVSQTQQKHKFISSDKLRIILSRERSIISNASTITYCSSLPSQSQLVNKQQPNQPQLGSKHSMSSRLTTDDANVNPNTLKMNDKLINHAANIEQSNNHPSLFQLQQTKHLVQVQKRLVQINLNAWKQRQKMSLQGQLEDESNTLSGYQQLWHSFFATPSSPQFVYSLLQNHLFSLFRSHFQLLFNSNIHYE